MSNKLGRHLYKHGLFSGYSEYRYGSAVSRPVTLAPIFGTARRESLASRAAELLEDWQSSPFQNEAPLRHQLRRSLCLDGYSWARSDAEAADVVDAAFTSLGIERPSEDEGQPDAAGEEYYCSWCACAIDEERRTRRQRFCSAECAQVAILYRERREEHYQGVVMRSAARMVARSKAPPRTCRHCHQTFQSDRETAVYCSPRCTSHGNLGERLLPDIMCEGCGKVAKPANRGARFCSLKCRSLTVQSERAERLASVIRDCEECGTAYSPTSSRARYCSDTCGSRARNREYRARGGAPAVYAYTCKCCGVGFTARKPKAPYCGKPCKDLAERYEAGQGKRLTARLFDYMVHRDHIPMTRLAVTDALFI